MFITLPTSVNPILEKIYNTDYRKEIVIDSKAEKNCIIAKTPKEKHSEYCAKLAILLIDPIENLVGSYTNIAGDKLCADMILHTSIYLMITTSAIEDAKIYFSP